MTEIVINSIGTQTATVSFAVSGTCTWSPSLQYADDSGSFGPLPSGAVEPSASANFGFTHPGLNAGSHTVSVKDPLTDAITTSNTFVVSSVLPAVTWNPSDKSSTVTLSAGNMTATSGGSSTPTSTPQGVRSTSAIPTTGTIAWEITMNALTQDWAAGVADGSFDLTSTGGAGSDSHAIGAYPSSGTGSQPPQSVFFNNTQLTSGTVDDSDGDAMSIVVSGTEFWFSTPAMRATSGVNWNNNTTATPVGAIGGFSFSGMGSTRYALFNSLEGGTSGTLNDGTSPFSTFLSNFLAANPGIKPLSQVIARRTWYENPGMDGSFWVTPFATTATWTTSGSEITVLRNGSNSSPTGYVHLKGDYSVPWVMGESTDPLVQVTDGTETIEVHIPLGTIVEEPASSTDQSIGGADATQPYLVWSISGATINTGSVVASGSVITGTYGMQIDDGSGQIMTDAVTGQPGTNNSLGGIQDYELTQANANVSYVIPHMLAYSLDPSQIDSSLSAVWPLNIVDHSIPTTGILPEGQTIGIPASTGRPPGKTRGFYLLFDSLQQYGWFFYNVSSNGCLSIECYSTLSANAALATDVVNSISDVIQYVCILNNQTGPSSSKGMASGGSPAFPPPPPLDLSPTGGVNVAPSTFGAWYPSGYDATPTNTP